jgi:hypothetical protein
MTFKLKHARIYRGLLWVERAYRWAGWLGLGLTAAFSLGSAFHHFRVLWPSPYITRTDLVLQCLALAGIFLVIGLTLSAFAFAISLGIQVGLSSMETSQTRIALLRRMAQRQSNADNVIRRQEAASTSNEHDVIQQTAAEQTLRRAR